MSEECNIEAEAGSYSLVLTISRATLTIYSHSVVFLLRQCWNKHRFINRRDESFQHFSILRREISYNQSVVFFSGLWKPPNFWKPVITKEVYHQVQVGRLGYSFRGRSSSATLSGDSLLNLLCCPIKVTLQTPQEATSSAHKSWDLYQQPPGHMLTTSALSSEV